MAKTDYRDNIGETISFQRALAELNKKLGPQVVVMANKIDDAGFISTGIKKLDTDLGGGFPRGQIVELFGLQSAGKSMLAMQVIKQAQLQGLDCVLFDVENSFRKDWAEKLGINLDKLAVIKETEAERIIEIIQQLLAANPGVIVIDSIAAMNAIQEMNGDMETAYMAPLARVLSRGLRQIVPYNRETVIICINQMRANITVMGQRGYNTPGGMSLKHAAAIRLLIKRDPKFLTENGKAASDTNPPTGQIVQYKIEKSKTSAPERVGSFKFYFDGKIEE